MSRFSLHVADWKGCTRCELHTGRQRVVQVRGTIPCDVLFVGEAPGESEDVLGKPFIGPAGDLQQTIIDRALAGILLCPECNSTKAIKRVTNGAVLPTMFCDECGDKDNLRPLTYALTNLVGCIPRTEDNKKAGQPPDDAIEACAPRLVELGDIARPKLIVMVGKLAKDWLEEGYKHSIPLCPGVPRIHVDHPAAILRANIAARGFMAQRSQVTIRNAAEEI